jgi:hypothetical protein
MPFDTLTAAPRSRFSLEDSGAINGEFHWNESPSVDLYARQEMIVQNVAAGRRACVEALDELAPHPVPWPADLRGKPTLSGTELVSEPGVNFRASPIYKLLELEGGPQTRGGLCFPRALEAIRAPSLPAIAPRATAFDDGSCKVLCGHFKTSRWV